MRLSSASMISSLSWARVNVCGRAMRICSSTLWGVCVNSIHLAHFPVAQATWKAYRVHIWLASMFAAAASLSVVLRAHCLLNMQIFHFETYAKQTRKIFGPFFGATVRNSFRQHFSNHLQLADNACRAQHRLSSNTLTEFICYCVRHTIFEHNKMPSSSLQGVQCSLGSCVHSAHVCWCLNVFSKIHCVVAWRLCACVLLCLWKIISANNKWLWFYARTRSHALVRTRFASRRP